MHVHEASKNTEDEVLKAAIAKYGKNQWYVLRALPSLPSAASDYYPQAQVQINKYGGRVMQPPPQSRSTASVSPQLSAMSHPSVGSHHPSLSVQRTKMEHMHDDPKRKYQCPTCPRGMFLPSIISRIALTSCP